MERLLLTLLYEMPCVKPGSVSQQDGKGSAALRVLQSWRERWGGPASPENGFMGRLAGTTGLVLPRLTPGRAFLRGNRGREPPETRRERVGYLLGR